MPSKMENSISTVQDTVHLQADTQSTFWEQWLHVILVCQHFLDNAMQFIYMRSQNMSGRRDQARVPQKFQ